jgi:hypothetical protein
VPRSRHQRAVRMSVPDDGDYSEFRPDQIAVVIAGLDPAIHLFRKKMDARVNPHGR